MKNYEKHIEFKKGTLCSVNGCKNIAEFEVVLYDYYLHSAETFYEQDYTCPFLCNDHLNINEKDAKGQRVPRSHVEYPFTNQHFAQGYNKYNPINEVYPEIYSINELENSKPLQVDLNNINEELIKYLAKHPHFLHMLSPRKFEELIAEILHDQGYEVTLTPATRDGGKDIIVVHKDIIGHQMLIVECKRYSENRKVGVEIVRSLYGTQQAGHYNQGILATTSTFSRDAIEFVRPLGFQLSLQDFTNVTKWCKSYKNSTGHDRK